MGVGKIVSRCTTSSVESQGITQNVPGLGRVARIGDIGHKLGQSQRGFHHGKRCRGIGQSDRGPGFAVSMVHHHRVLQRVTGIGDLVIIDAGKIVDANQRVDQVLAGVVLGLGHHRTDVPNRSVAGAVGRKTVQGRLTGRLSIDGGDALEGVGDVQTGIVF